MEEEDKTVEEESSSVLQMSDDELENYNPEVPQEEEQEPESEEEEEPVEEQEEEDSTEEEEADSEEPEDTSESSEEAEEQTISSQDNIDFEHEYKRLLSPFRASKREINVKNVDDARRLMQMGADYNFKMEALKPQLRIMRALEKNGLLNQEKINFLIDLDKKNPEAIKKYFKEKEIDPIDLDLSEGESEYKPNSYTPTDQEVALDDVLDEIRETPAFQRTIDELGNRWDGESKKVLMENPALIKVINDQIQSGIYDQVRNVVENERLMGRLPGLNDLMAYKTVGDALQAQGAFKNLEEGSKPQRKASQDPKLKARKRAASPTKRSSRPQTSAQDYNPLSLSDEEFEKMGIPNFA